VTPTTTLIVLFSIATAVAIAARWLRVPYTVALVIVGLALGALHLVTPPHLTKELLFAVLLPGLLFEAAFRLDGAEFWRNKMAIAALAVPGVVVAIGLTALVTTIAIRAFALGSGFSWQYGVVFGALIAATDPIAVVSLFKHLDAPKRLHTLVEGESLLNDGTAVVFLTLILSYVAGETSAPGAFLASFVWMVGGGALIGLAFGFGASLVTKQVDDARIEITLTTIAAYGSFALAEQLHVSGVIATVAAGMVCGHYAHKAGMSAATRFAAHAFWDYVAFALNSVVFLLIGFEVNIGALLASWQEIAIAYLGVIASRAAVIALITVLLRRTRERIPAKWAAALAWGGLRGALSMVLALALAFDFPQRSLLITMTFGVVLLSLLIQGLTMSWLLKQLGLGAREEAQPISSRPS
jgi:CPA1 family monovalent cation:H+ antiporter